MTVEKRDLSSASVSTPNDSTNEISLDVDFNGERAGWDTISSNDINPTGEHVLGLTASEQDFVVPDQDPLLSRQSQKPEQVQKEKSPVTRSPIPDAAEMEETVRGGLDDYLQMFFGTKELVEKDGTVQPKAGHWERCKFGESCTAMESVPLPKGTSTDRKEAELDLFYSILYSLLTHITSVHSDDARRPLRLIRFKMSTLCVQRNERIMFLKRSQTSESVDKHKAAH
ncbi:uncharacterized protein FOMMEDRAFT_146510 [Fomitiporia mediterranea MF3/22]|uniref:uncharacterized protein n=1 Tax=Fomitiporia mediterranea (strain MF3/22) TaxID=694068 RepID=UPI00044080D0|nr:uncharacterized protein FOMMEDRAFT_146510 [Fomitiporia mediterranea MF3/22]EJD02588.1 hypothetical protein FOMMEDRAFT_146510 [Fomitiporia mediterranea MF3/22]